MLHTLNVPAASMPTTLSLVVHLRPDLQDRSAQTVGTTTQLLESIVLIALVSFPTVATIQ